MSWILIQELHHPMDLDGIVIFTSVMDMVNCLSKINSVFSFTCVCSLSTPLAVVQLYLHFPIYYPVVFLHIVLLVLVNSCDRYLKANIYAQNVIEDAKNESSCVQAIRYLIAKADTEIQALEDELAIYQCQLKWAEEDEKKNPYELSCATFKRKIDTLTKSIKDVRNKDLSNEHDLDATVKIQRPAERICDIISALVKQNFSAPDKQVEDLSNGTVLVNSGLVDDGLDLKQKETTPESTELTTDFGSVNKHGDTVSEESCSDTAKYAIRDSIEGRDVSKSVVEVTEETEVDAYACTPEVNNGFIGHTKAYSNNGNSRPPALQHGIESEECMTGSKNSGNGFSPLSAKAEVVVKVEDDTNDMSIRHTITDSFCKTQIEAYQEVKENQSKSVDNIQRTYGRKKSSSSQRQKVQKKNPSGARKYGPSLIQQLQGKNGKRQCPSTVGNTQSHSPSSEAESFCSLPESTVQPVDIVHGNQPGVLGGKKCKLLGASREDASIQFQEVEPSLKEDSPCASENFSSKPQKELVVCLQSPRVAGGITLRLHSSSADLHNVQSKSSAVEDIGTKPPPAYDLESLKLKLSQDPEFINKLKVAELKEILKCYKVRGFSKFKKEQMVEELNNQLRAT